jgi:GNAT superfamily N-acetyltransferase
MNIRRAQFIDLPFIIALLANDKLGKRREDYRLPLPQKYNSAFDTINNDPNQELMLMVDSKQEIIGTFQLSFIPSLTYQGGLRAQIEGVRIHKQFRGKGLGRVLFEWAIARARDKGAHILQLTTDKQRPKAIRFYEDLGFVASHEGMKLSL